MSEVEKIGADEIELSAALGYMMNARIDLETGETKAHAINTLKGGINRLRSYLESQK